MSRRWTLAIVVRDSGLVVYRKMSARCKSQVLPSARLVSKWFAHMEGASRLFTRAQTWIAHTAKKPLPCKVSFGRYAAQQSALSLAYAPFFLCACVAISL